MDFINIWSVDSIQRMDKGYFVRFLHLTKADVVGARYLLLSPECVQAESGQENLESSTVAFGRSYSFKFAAIHSAVREVIMNGIRLRIPVVAADNFQSCLSRDVDAEKLLLEQIHRASAEAQELPRDSSDGSANFVDLRPLTITVFNVGQGETILLEFPNRKTWLIDAYFWGNSNYQDFQSLLASRRITKLDRFVVSHFHHDHIKYASRIIRDYSPAKVVVNPSKINPTSASRNLLRDAANRNSLWVLSGTTIETIGGVVVRSARTLDFAGSGLTSDPNEHAIAIGIKTPKDAALLSGDIPGHLLRRFVGAYPTLRSGRCRLYKVSHHCSHTGHDCAFLRSYSPTCAAVSCGAGNRYRHPHNPPYSCFNGMCGNNPCAVHITSVAKQNLTYVLQ